ncbi:DUF5133 domain-containing protein [Actinacidiphila yeochonensis]|uniref:DUF5133 domain-containing protein n=1 Tax=Actinacidiphila yeochonensis TaxID=89050 RepID=UPI0005654260|nr:DUF5133 domain-containing protein [Actinacidiphila yeochonensis]
MLMAHPTVLTKLVERYEALRLLVEEQHADGSDSDSNVLQQLQDTMYTLCVSTGTRQISDALSAARAHIERSVALVPEADATAA